MNLNSTSVESTPEGRARRFKERLAELMAPRGEGRRSLTLDEAIHEMRTGVNEEDRKLLAAMGCEVPLSHHAQERLVEDQFLDSLHRQAERQAAEQKEVDRRAALNVRLDQLTLPRSCGGKGFSLDDAINQMRANPADAELLKAMGGCVAYHPAAL